MCFCNMFLQTSLISYCLTKNKLCVSRHQLVYYYMSITSTVAVALHHQAWSGPDTHWWLSPRTGTCFVSTSSLEVRVPPSSTGSGGLWPTSTLFCHLNICLRKQTGYEILIFASLIGTNRIWRSRKSKNPERFLRRRLKRRLHPGRNPALASSHHPHLVSIISMP